MITLIYGLIVSYAVGPGWPGQSCFSLTVMERCTWE